MTPATTTPETKVSAAIAVIATGMLNAQALGGQHARPLGGAHGHDAVAICGVEAREDSWIAASQCLVRVGV